MGRAIRSAAINVSRTSKSSVTKRIHQTVLKSNTKKDRTQARRPDGKHKSLRSALSDKTNEGCKLPSSMSTTMTLRKAANKSYAESSSSSFENTFNNGAIHSPRSNALGTSKFSRQNISVEKVSSKNSMLESINEVITSSPQFKDEVSHIKKPCVYTNSELCDLKQVTNMLPDEKMKLESKKEAVLQEASSRLNQLITGNFKQIAVELEGQDPYEYIRAYTAGLQEFIEAATFHYYLKEKSLRDWKVFDDLMIYTVKEFDTNSTDDHKSLEKAGMDSVEVSRERSVKTLVPPSEYILGIGDLTGELMRKCINNLGSGNIEGCYQTCAFVKEIYNGFLMIGNMGHKEIKRKVFTLKQSLQKMENACYMIHVRGSEIPKHMLADVFSGGSDKPLDEDEGFY